MSVAQTNLVQRARAVDPDGEYRLSKMPYPNLDLGDEYVRVGQTEFFNTIQKNVSYSTNSSIGNIISAGGQCDIRVPAKSFAIADGITLNLQVQNSTGAATTLVPTAYLF